MYERDADVIVIGAGPGGLTAAAYLAATGRRVVVVDARDAPGGHMSSFTHGGYEFDIGLHYTKPDDVRQVLEPLGINPSFEDFDSAAQFTMRFPDQTVLIPRGGDALRAALHEAFPFERAAVDGFLDTVTTLAGAFDHLQHHARHDLAALPRELMTALRHGRSTLGHHLQSIGASPRLQAALAWADGSFAVAPSRLGLLPYSVVMATYLEGMGYPHGGSTAITSALVDVIIRDGGTLLLGTEVTRILVAGGHVRGVRVRPAALGAASAVERELTAPAVVAASDLRRTFVDLLPAGSVPERMLRRMRTFDLPQPLAVAYVVVDRDLRAEGMRNTNTMVFGSDDVEAAYASVARGELPVDGMALMWSASHADPGNSRLCRPGQTNLQLISIAPAGHAFWGVVPGAAPTELYRVRRQQTTEHLMRLAEQAVPGIRDAVAFIETATPITEERFMRCTDGVSYGMAFTPAQALRRPGPKGPIDGLYLAGAATRPFHGLIGTLHGGVGAAAAVSGVPQQELLGRRALVGAA